MYTLTIPFPPQATSTPTIFAYNTKIVITETLAPSPTKISTSTVIPTPAINNLKDKANLILIPSGSFIMGSSSKTDPYFWGAEGPPHTVNLRGFYIYETEVTNEMYENCVKEKACPRPEQTYSRTRKNYYGNPEFQNYPVIYVSWVHALSYCQWAGGRLPTEAEWEKAARGTDGRLFPWGNTASGDLSNFCGDICANDTYPVGQFITGRSPYGVLDMAGNVWEWAQDFFNTGYYSKSPVDNPRGPANGDRRVIRGGAWHNPAEGVRVVARASLKPNNTLDTLGFRCVVELP
ncbi:MAG: SUMF1/EgtB/PvdO family nonheme iron enzyme [Chloroflexota bacterium]